MTATSDPAPLSPFRWLHQLLGGVLALALLVALAEAYLRWFPPSDLHAFLGDDSPLEGVFVPDRDTGVTYRSWNDFCAANPESMRRHRHVLLPPAEGLPVSTAAPPWLVIGSSFGFELCSHLCREHPEQSALTLDRREALTVRLAQVRTLLDHDGRPGRVLLVLARSDYRELGEQPLATHTCNRHGARVFRPRVPGGPAGWLVGHSRLAFTGWARLGLHRGNSGFRLRQLDHQVSEVFRRDLEQLFAALGGVQRSHREVPITVVLIPGRREVLAGRGFQLEDTLLPILEKAGLDGFHPRQAFLDHPRQEALFVADGHLSREGNRLLAHELMEHIARQGSAPPMVRR